jgi:hypothetical protein
VRNLLLLCAALSLACSTPEESTKQTAAAATATTAPSLTPESARQLLESSPEWSDYQFTYASWSVPLRAREMNDAHRRTVQELREAGWLAVDGDGNAVLTEKAKNNKRFLVRSNASLDIVPLAKKEIVAVSAPQPQPDGNTQVTIDWRWVPNEIGSVLKSGLVAQVFASPHRAKATLMPSDGGWTVLMIEPAS